MDSPDSEGGPRKRDQLKRIFVNAPPREIARPFRPLTTDALLSYLNELAIPPALLAETPGHRLGQRELLELVRRGVQLDAKPDFDEDQVLAHEIDHARIVGGHGPTPRPLDMPVERPVQEVAESVVKCVNHLLRLRQRTNTFRQQADGADFLRGYRVYLRGSNIVTLRLIRAKMANLDGWKERKGFRRAANAIELNMFDVRASTEPIWKTIVQGLVNGFLLDQILEPTKDEEDAVRKVQPRPPSPVGRWPRRFGHRFQEAAYKRNQNNPTFYASANLF